MGLFDGTPMPSWQSGEDVSLLEREMGIKSMAGYERAKSQASSQTSSMVSSLLSYGLSNMSQSAVAPIAKELQGVNSEGDAWNKIKENPQWLMDKQTGPFVNQYMKGWQQHGAIQARAATSEAASIEGKTKLADINDFIKRKAKLAPDDRAGIDSMSKNPDGGPSQMAWDALSTAEQRMQVEAQNKAKEAELAATLRGEIPTTTITGDKVTQKFTPDKPTGPDVKLVEQQIGSDKFARNPKTGHAFKLSDPDKPLGVTQLLKEQKDAKKEGDTAAIAWIQDFVKKNYPKNAGLFGITNAPSGTSGGATNSLKIGRFTVTPE